MIPTHWFGVPPLFDPTQGVTVLEPPGSGPGNWAGAPSALYAGGKFHLSYRLRRPLTEGRGWTTRIDESDDGIHFRNIWAAFKEDFSSTSIERSALVHTLEGRYRLYVSYVDEKRNRWLIDMLEADTPAAFDPKTRRIVLDPDDIDSEGVKDPWVAVIGRMYYMFASHGPRATVSGAAGEQALHATGNVFTTGLVAHPTGLAVSADGIHFDWKGDIIAPGEANAWDCNVARMACMVYQPPVFNIFYDGRTSRGDVYEDRTGLVVSTDLQVFHRVSVDAPILQSPWGSGALRYMDAVPACDKMYYYYECCRPDGSHETRVNIVDL
jgi:hypothetical protein